MSKEMIISVNGREKKIAIMEDGRVTEFYIERNEDNSGVVGNIYKGRVQRVLPGMQSAFVDIGLERDAFLYVSDFFDEEEEIERIVMEKSKEQKSADEADREATDVIHKERLKRDKKIDDAQEKAEIEEDPADNDGDKSSDNRQRKSQSSRKRGRSSKKADDARDEKTQEESDDKTEEKSKRGDRRRSRDDKPAKRENVLDASDLKIEDSGFERIVDEDEDTGEMLKDAMMQEAITDKVRSIEFDMESTDEVEVGSLIDSVDVESNGFERIADEDEETDSKKSSKRAPRKRTSRSRKPAAGKRTAAKSADDTESEQSEPDAEEEKTTASKRSSRSGSSRSKKTSSRKTSSKSKKAKEEEVLEDAEASVTESPDIAEMAARRGSRGGRRTSNKKTANASTPPDTDSKTHTDKSYKATEIDEPITAEGEIADAEFQKKGSGRRGSRRRNDRSQPKITDLLHEGQDVLVQIAKEPIARKGARITSHIALPGRYIVYMPTIEHLGVSRKIGSSKERSRLRSVLQKVVSDRKIQSGGFIVRTAGTGKTEEELGDDANYLVNTWKEIKKDAEKGKSPSVIHQDLDIILRLLRDHLSDEFTAIRVDSEEEYLRIVEFVNRIQPKFVKRVKFHTLDEPILETYGVSEEIDKALKHRVWLKSGGYLVINQTEALIAIDVNTGKFVGKGNARLEDTITKTNMEAVDEIARQIRLRDLGGIIVLDLIDMEDRRNRNKVLQALQERLSNDKSPTKVLSFNDFGLIIMTRKRVKQSLERTLCSPCSYCEGAGWVKSAQTVCYEILDEARRLSKGLSDVRQTTLRVHPEVAQIMRNGEREIFDEIEEYLGVVDLTGDPTIHQEQFDFAFV
ncbi:MAG: Rne/Rng family ribonuclease [Pyrinomonadaceae bacterium]